MYLRPFSKQIGSDEFQEGRKSHCNFTPFRPSQVRAHLPSSQAQSWKASVQRLQEEMQVPEDLKAITTLKSEGNRR